MKPGGFGDVPIGCVRRICSNCKIKKIDFLFVWHEMYTKQIWIGKSGSYGLIPSD
ncbi:unnamed protein product [Linum tenue]|uniref:Uncharacterized protein n=1 Tax=Linum tenue TaxID=586396 RepID=A0AAV0L8T1_9ROSI|nr:unnamed protein product [Linum tenue]